MKKWYKIISILISKVIMLSFIMMVIFWIWKYEFQMNYDKIIIPQTLITTPIDRK